MEKLIKKAVEYWVGKIDPTTDPEKVEAFRIALKNKLSGLMKPNNYVSLHTFDNICILKEIADIVGIDYEYFPKEHIVWIDKIKMNTTVKIGRLGKITEL